MERNIHRGDIFWIDFPHDGIGSEIKKVRPAVVVSNDKNNLFSPNIEICCLTTAEKKKPLPTHVEILMISKKIPFSVKMCIPSAKNASETISQRLNRRSRRV